MDVPIGNAPVSSIQCMASRHAAPVKQTAQRLFFALRPALFVLASLACAGTAVAQPAELSVAYREQVPQRLDLPPDAVLHYAELAREQFSAQVCHCWVRSTLRWSTAVRRCRPSWSIGLRWASQPS